MEELEKITPCISSVSKKGQTVIPRQLRKALGVQEGDHLVWELRGNNIHVKKLTLKKVKKEGEEFSLTEAEWKKLSELIRMQAKEGKYTTYPSVKAAKTHLSPLRSSVKGGG